MERQINELQKELIKTKEEMVELLQQTKIVREAQKSPESPVNYNSPDFDHILNRQMDEATVLKGIISQVYHGRMVSVRLMASGTIEIIQQSHHLVMAQTKEKPYVPTRIILSQETFFLMLESMRFAEHRFSLDRKMMIEKLTGGGDFNFKDAIAIL